MVSLIQNVFYLTTPGTFVLAGAGCLWLTTQTNDWAFKTIYFLTGIACFIVGCFLYQTGLKSVEKIAKNDNKTKEKNEMEKTNRENIRQRNIQLRTNHEKEKTKHEIVKGVKKVIGL
ncbi:MAG: hypothetical protein WC356_05855 [Candidatus Micrarchaeia archaeon]|jgi:hypothetical protein